MRITAICYGYFERRKASDVESKKPCTDKESAVDGDEKPSSSSEDDESVVDGDKKPSATAQNSSNTSTVRNGDGITTKEDDRPRNSSQHKKKQKFAVGTKVSKSFYDPELKVNRQYSGKVISYDIQSNEYLIRYEDEDEEDISEKELSTILDGNDSGKKSTSTSDQCRKVNKQQMMKRNRTSLPRSSPITRRQLHCLTGGIHGGYKNPLKVGTPVLDCGGRAFATKGGRVHHICIKATNDGKAHNHPLPKSINEKFLLYRTTKRGGLGNDICSLIEQPNHPPIPIFWEPAEQANGGAKKVLYVGHWKVSSIIDYSKKPITYMNHPRCALIKFNFDHFSTRWNHIIRRCHDKTTDEIKAMNWDIDETDETAQAEDNTVTRCNKRKRGT